MQSCEYCKTENADDHKYGKECGNRLKSLVTVDVQRMDSSNIHELNIEDMKGKAFVYSTRGKYDQPITELVRAIRSHPHVPELHFQLGLIYLKNGQTENAVNEFANLPGIGKKTALRLVLHILHQPNEDTLAFTHALEDMKNEIKICKKCHNISEGELCSICSNPNRDESLICVVESIKEVIAIENTSQYKGLYHVLGGRISPMDGIGPKDLNIGSLENRINTENIAEVILALSTTMEGDTTNFYIYRRLSSSKTPITTLARGVSVGDELEYADEITLGRSLVNRIPYHGK